MKYKTFRAIVVSSAVGLAGGGTYLLIRSSAESSPPPPAPAPAPSASAPPAPAPTTASTSPAPQDGTALRSTDWTILAGARQTISGKRINDAFPQAAFKVMFFADHGLNRITRAKVDLDRDGQWDEEWLFEQLQERQKVVRKVAPAHDGNFTDRYELENGRWIRK